MIPFNVLDPSLDIFRSYFIEASAGTGKTFAIEQLIVRLLTEGKAPLSIDQILAVTFTRKAAREMKQRIHANLQKAGLHSICFDETQIFTIHGFCHQMLSEFAFEAGVSFETEHPDSHNYQELLRQTIHDYFAIGLPGKDPIEMEKILKSHRSNWDALVQTIAKKMLNYEKEERLIGEIIEECRKRFIRASQQKEIDTPDGILKKMAQALSRPAFVQKIRQKYRAAIVDEFQDTDPVQFAIFKQLFLDDPTCLVYFVGDSKQSIYGFRRADLYTYLSAAELFKNRGYLETNFRSTPKLVEALNLLFSSTYGWNTLPKSHSPLSYCNVKAGKLEATELEDGQGSIHFLLGKTALGRGRTWPPKEFEEKILFPHLVNQICALKCPLSEMVILVKDRFQAARLQLFLTSYGIPASFKRSLVGSSAFQAMHDLLGWLKSLRSTKALNTVLAGPLIRCSKEELSQPSQKMDALQELYVQKGFSVFIKAFMDSYQVGDSEFRQLAELLMEEGEESFETLALLDPELSEKESCAVSIMTIFASKGLEFEVVFALALASRHPSEEQNFEERDAEKMRQLYVALTRAKKRVYIPFIFDTSVKKVALGSASPLELFGARWEKSWNFEEIYKQLPLKPEKSLPYLERFSEQTSLTFKWMEETAISRLHLPEKTKVAAPLPIFTPFKENILVSFTALAKKQPKEPTQIILPAEKTIHSLPLGTETGTLLHAIFEEIFEARFIEIDKIISKRLLHTSLQGWEEIVSKQVKQLLTLPLEGFCLQDLKEYATEMEFFFPKDEQTIKGFADLVFRVHGKYYLLDWKSNWLGPTDQDYHEDNLKKAMEENDYYLQAQIYTEAVKRYVKLFDNCPFGGAFYVFIRGKTWIKI
ncbi:MAG TPA: UvrD-helicase domain-containing protein [Rhabdochlamydiaceae bacterium]|nr:UvrD-helicase domain-containing protein [Rhabdochlamydiaceae bacterium]